MIPLSCIQRSEFSFVFQALHEIQHKNDTLTEKVEELKDKLEWSDHLKGTLEKDLEATREKLAEAQQLNLSKKIALDSDDRVKEIGL